MCVSTGRADFTSTIVYLGKKFHPQHGEIFVLGYQNRVQNLSGGPNAMLLHLPAREITAKNAQDHFIVTKGCKSILKDMVVALVGASRGGEIQEKGIFMGGYTVFEHDIYHVVVFYDTAAIDEYAIQEALSLVPANKRIAFNQPLFEFYKARYPGYALVLCCFDNAHAREADPLLLWYKPMDTEYFMWPALDCHTGDVPSLYSQVDTDHWIILGTDHLSGRGRPVYYTDPISAHLIQFLPTRVIGTRFSEKMRNGDFFVHESLIDSRLSNMVRIGPPA